MFGLTKQKKKEIQTPLGLGTCHSGTPHGDTLEVSHFHRGNVLTFQWPALHPKASEQVLEVAQNLLHYIDCALNEIESDEGFKRAVTDHGGVYPDGIHWFDQECDFTLTFGYVDWPDGTLSFRFRDGKIVDTDVHD